MCNYDIIKKLIINGLNNVDEAYYTLKTSSIDDVTGKDKIKNIIRERNFCYELYHQIRLIDEQKHFLSDNLIMSAEIDKSGHRKINNRKIPDFIIHEPGNMDYNEVIIEVKGTIDIKGIAKDFYTLSLFIEKYRYAHGIFILFGHSINELDSNLSRIKQRKEFMNIKNIDILKNVEIFCKKSNQELIEIIELYRLIKKSETL